MTTPSDESTYHLHFACKHALEMIAPFCEECNLHSGCSENDEVLQKYCGIRQLKNWLQNQMFSEENLKPITELTNLQDENGYPTEVFLVCIAEKIDLPNTKEDLESIIDVIQSVWWGGENSIIYNEDALTLELITGGWSGNEDIISAFSRTFLWFTSIRLEKSEGYYLLKFPECLYKKTKEEQS